LLYYLITLIFNCINIWI